MFSTDGYAFPETFYLGMFLFSFLNSKILFHQQQNSL